MMELRDLPGLGPQSIADLRRMGIQTIDDLLAHYPLRYEDFSVRKTVNQLQLGETVSVDGVITSIAARVTPRRRMTLVEAIFGDETGGVRVTWFNQRYLVKTLTPGTRVRLSGTVEKGPKGMQITNPSYEFARAGASVHTGRIVPIYSLTGSLTQKRLRSAVASALKLPQAGDPELVWATRQIHFPDDQASLTRAKEVLAYDELFLYELTHLKSRAELKKLAAPAIPTALEKVKGFVDGLPFPLTGAQRKAAWQILQDMERGEPMNRLLEGDVGSGKTVVAAIAALNASAGGFQTAVLAPTEILASQHYETFKKLLDGVVDVGICTRTTKEHVDADVLIGTHAMLQQGVTFRRLGLVIVDEQHRFGVRQRQAMQEKELENVGVPHLLSMTATPIPRTLALSLYGDLDLSVLDEMPKGRKPVKTTLMKRGKETEVYETICTELDAGRQAFVVCSLIDPSDELEAKSVTEFAEQLKKGPLKGYKMAILHGRMKSAEKEEIMAQYVAGELDVLIATTVIEVGVNVPNATVMFVEGAERFGLAQLHQLRGRVGRSDLPSVCFLHPSGFVPEKTYERLRALVDCQNGFELAERDLALRGAGDVYGTQQSGFPEFKIADPMNVGMVARARNAASDLLREDPELVAHAEVLDRLKKFAARVHFE